MDTKDHPRLIYFSYLISKLSLKLFIIDIILPIFPSAFLCNKMKNWVFYNRNRHQVTIYSSTGICVVQSQAEILHQTWPIHIAHYTADSMRLDCIRRSTV